MSARESLPPRLLAIDAVVLAALTVLATSPLADAYEGSRWLVAVIGGFALSATIALGSRILQWGALLTGLLVIVGYLLVGPAIAVPDRAAAGVLPSAGAERDLLVGIVDAWRAALTLPVQLGTDYAVLVVPFVISLLGTLFATLLLWRSRWPAIGSFGVVGMFAAAATFGTRVTDLPLARGIVLVIVLVVWTRWRAMRAVRTSWVRRIAMTSSVVLVAGLVGWGLSTAMATGDARQVLRDHVDPPLERLDFKSPLSKYRDYYKNQKEASLFTVDGAPEGARVQLATMDDFDGIVWNVSTAGRTAGSSAFKRATPSSSGRAITVTIKEYEGPWVPTIGTATGVTMTQNGDSSAVRQLLLNPSTGAIAQYGDVRPGDQYTVDWNPRPSREDVPSDTSADRALLATPPEVQLAQLDRLAQTWLAEAGATSDMEIATALESSFRDKGFYSNGLEEDVFQTASGHGAKRIADLLAEPNRMVGNDEQYASAMAVAAQNLGLPARVALGFEADAGPDYTGDDIAAWVEIKFIGAGWVVFDPTPPEDKTPTILQQDPNPVPQPNVVQPPVLPNQPADAVGTPPEGGGEDLASRLWDLILMILGILWDIVKVLLLLSPLWLLLLVKRRRRRQRRRADDPLVRLSGGWREVTDRARDLGTRLPQSHTRYENGVLLTHAYPTAGLGPLATVADRHVFGPVVPTDEEIDGYWADVDSALKRMRRAAPWWRRPLALFSPASIPWRQVRAATVDRLRRLRLRVARSQIARRVGSSVVDAATQVTNMVSARARRERR